MSNKLESGESVQYAESGDVSAPHRGDSLVGWGVAATTASKVSTAGPKLSVREIQDVVSALRTAADEAVDHVQRITQLEAAAGLRNSPVLVVDRATWSKATIESFKSMLTPTLRRLWDAKGHTMSSASTAVSAAVSGTELGVITGFLSANVLGQFDPFAGRHGRLLLVAPNIVTIERELMVEPSDFRLWVCLHEQTHRVQFAAAPWLQGHLQENITQLTAGMLDSQDALADRLKNAAKVASEAFKGRKSGSDSEELPSQSTLMSAIQTPEERAILSHVTAVMSLLEGHANVVMDAIDASIVPSVKTIRRRFDDRGRNRSSLENFVRRLLGLDAKMRQYRDGQIFVEYAVKELGMSGFNVVWEGPENLPTEHELHHPQEWVERMRSGQGGPGNQAGQGDLAGQGGAGPAETVDADAGAHAPQTDATSGN